MLSRIGAVKHSPSGMLRCPWQGRTGIPLIENSNSVPGAVIRTRSAAYIRRTSGSWSRAILA
jgi:hypothetical protein